MLREEIGRLQSNYQRNCIFSGPLKYNDIIDLCVLIQGRNSKNVIPSVENYILATRNKF